MPSSRLVAENFKRPLSVNSKMFPRMGRVLRYETARPTAETPRTRSFCLQATFIGNLSPRENNHSTNREGQQKRVRPFSKGAANKGSFLSAWAQSGERTLLKVLARGKMGG